MMMTFKAIYHQFPFWFWELFFFFAVMIGLIFYLIFLGGLIEIMTEKPEVKQKSLTLYVVFSILVILIFTVIEMIVSTITGVSHDTLTTCFYSVFGGEILCCALIKIFKLKTKEEEDE